MPTARRSSSHCSYWARRAALYQRFTTTEDHPPDSAATAAAAAGTSATVAATNDGVSTSDRYCCDRWWQHHAPRICHNVATATHSSQRHTRSHPQADKPCLSPGDFPCCRVFIPYLLTANLNGRIKYLVYFSSKHLDNFFQSGHIKS